MPLWKFSVFPSRFGFNKSAKVVCIVCAGKDEEGKDEAGGGGNTCCISRKKTPESSKTKSGNEVSWAVSPLPQGGCQL